MKAWRLGDLVFPLCLLSFVAVGVKYFSAVFTTNTRWAFLGALALLLFRQGLLLAPFRSRFGPALAVYGFWGLCTAAWSIVPSLSILKALAFVLASTVFLAAGHAWAARGNPRGLFSYLAPVLVVALFAGFFDRGAPIQMGAVEIYTGLTGNPNYLGVLEAMALPFAIWLAYENWRRPAWRVVSLLVVAALLLALWLAGSRSAFLSALAIGVGAFCALTASQRLLTVGGVGAAVVGLMVLVPTIQHSISVRVINKGQAEQGVFFSRQLVWAESYDHAQQGGLFGVGFGATAGAADLSVKSRGLTSFGYGREKGNSQLAVWEEIGLIGLSLYAILIVSILATIASAWRLARDRRSRLQLGLLFGTMVGFLIQSVFEAWWVAPGSSEFAYFFAALGVASGLAQRLSEEAATAARLQRQGRRTPSPTASASS